MKKKIIVLEDDPAIREVIEYILTEAKLSVESYERAESFWKAIHDANADLILLDVMLPDGNGIDICNQLKSQETTSNIPVIIMSAHYNLINDHPCSADDFIRKPFDIRDFVKRIQTYLAKVEG
ncbi:response regulator transcription factor [Olivibacter sp. XZL3]|uniref:response regulator transcription factor n=1 Tax=Olivibacter sp. XZL3 TaxID=1735116 RepID=UPI001066A271|nr:response regulator [Olivibacter sp. XZL3]